MKWTIKSNIRNIRRHMDKLGEEGKTEELLELEGELRMLQHRFKVAAEEAKTRSEIKNWKEHNGKG